MAHASSTARLTAAARPGAAQILSDERTYTRWAHARWSAPVNEAPTRASSRIGRLRLRTEDGLPDVYLLLRRQLDLQGRAWIKVRIPGRPNGRTGWVPESALGPTHETPWALVIDRRRLLATLTLDGRPVWQAPVGIGRPSAPTPSGHYWVRELFRVPGHSLYGPYAFGTSAYSSLSDWPGGGVVGIHGTNEPALIPGYPSHGCIRLRNPDITYLANHLTIGAPVRIV
jgi:hypothetical protein